MSGYTVNRAIYLDYIRRGLLWAILASLGPVLTPLDIQSLCLTRNVSLELFWYTWQILQTGNDSPY